MIKMTGEMLNQRIIIDSKICFGKPHIRGTRIKVSFILDLLSSELSITQILLEYPHLSKEDVMAAIKYAKNQID